MLIIGSKVSCRRQSQEKVALYITNKYLQQKYDIILGGLFAFVDILFRFIFIPVLCSSLKA